MLSRLVPLALTAAVAASAVACRLFDPPTRPEATCARACASRATQCSDDQCLRGCNLALDKIIEREGPNVVACVADAGARCDDPVWAACAVRTGAHADGGPPAPPPPKEYEAEEEPPPEAPDAGGDDDW